MERKCSLKHWLPNGKLLLLSLTKCHGEPCSLLSRITTKVSKNCKTFSSKRDQDHDQMFKTKTKTSSSKTKTKTMTFIFVLEAPRDQDLGLEDYITVFALGARRGRSFHAANRSREGNAEGNAKCLSTRDDTNAGIFVPKTIRSLEHSFPGPFVPWNFRSRDRSFPGPFVLETEYYAENSFP